MTPKSTLKQNEWVEEVPEIRYGIHSSPFGHVVIGLTKSSVCVLLFLESNREREALKRIKMSWPKAVLVRDDARTTPYAKRIFSSAAKKQHIPLVLKGTDFQIKVWEALLAIPKGHVTSYADVARAIGKPSAARAVGSACGKNTITYLIPCHRVLTSSGGLGGYNGGTARKELILQWEAAHMK
jgi:AraC family transcriptional regulator of adaptative response/methylated-DNA-[protein]-cysteine methyltransferase